MKHVLITRKHIERSLLLRCNSNIDTADNKAQLQMDELASCMTQVKVETHLEKLTLTHMLRKTLSLFIPSRVIKGLQKLFPSQLLHNVSAKSAVKSKTLSMCSCNPKRVQSER